MLEMRRVNAAYPFEQSTGEKLKTILSISIFLGFILFFIQPYGFNPTMHSRLSIGFMGIGFLSLIINYFGIPYFFPKYFEDDNWSIFKAFLFLSYNFLLIGLWHHIFNALFFKHDLQILVSGTEILNTLVKILFIGWIASGFLILIRYNFLARKYLEVSQDLNYRLQNQLKIVTPNPDNEIIEIMFEGKSISLVRNDLLYISSEGNYLGIHLKSKPNSLPTLYRGRIKSLEEALKSYPELYRCHRSYIVNLKYLKATHGNSQGLSISLLGKTQRLPVARPNIKELNFRIAQVHTNTPFITEVGD